MENYKPLGRKLNRECRAERSDESSSALEVFIRKIIRIHPQRSLHHRYKQTANIFYEGWSKFWQITIGKKSTGNHHFGPSHRSWHEASRGAWVQQNVHLSKTPSSDRGNTPAPPLLLYHIELRDWPLIDEGTRSSGKRDKSKATDAQTPDFKSQTWVTPMCCHGAHAGFGWNVAFFDPKLIPIECLVTCAMKHDGVRIGLEKSSSKISTPWLINAQDWGKWIRHGLTTGHSFRHRQAKCAERWQLILLDPEKKRNMSWASVLTGDNQRFNVKMKPLNPKPITISTFSNLNKSYSKIINHISKMSLAKKSPRTRGKEF